MKKKLARALTARIKTLRETAGLSQQEVAARGDLSVSLVAKLEQGKKVNPRASTLLALALALGVTPGALLDDLLPANRPAPEGEKDADEPKAEAPAGGVKKVAKKKKKPQTAEA